MLRGLPARNARPTAVLEYTFNTTLISLNVARNVASVSTFSAFFSGITLSCLRAQSCEECCEQSCEECCSDFFFQRFCGPRTEEEEEEKLSAEEVRNVTRLGVSGSCRRGKAGRRG